MEKRLYETDAALHATDTEVVEVGVEDGRPWARLAATVFYPEGGGQPADHGTLGKARVVDVQKVNNRVRHYLDRPLQPGPVRAELDRTRRFDHMQQHTGQHVLTALCEDLHGWETLAFHLGETYSSIDLNTADASARGLESVEDAVNEAIRAARSVRVRMVGRDELAAMKVRSRGLPDDVGDEIRLVEIEGLDLNTCGGTHVASTAALQVCRLLGTERIRGTVRLKFAFGHRVVELLRAAEARETDLKAVFGAAPDDFATVAAGWDRDRRDLARALKRTEAELAEALAVSLAEAAETLVVRHFPGRDAAFLRTLASSVLRTAPAKILALFGDDGAAAFFLVAAGETSGHDAGSLGRAAQEALGGKGGGKGALYQGRGPDAGRIAAALEAVRL